jgi:hypothetical protein
MSNKNINFDDTLEDTDYGLIICGQTGRLKGLWIPEGKDDDYIPDSIIHLCINYFGINPEEFNYEDSDDDLGDPPTDTLH